MWNCFNYARTRQLRHARELFSSLISSIGASRRQSAEGAEVGFTEQETRYTVIGAASTTVPGSATRSLLLDNDDELLTYFNDPVDVEYDPDYWVADNNSLPILPPFYHLLQTSISIPNGSALLISKRIKQILRQRSIVASYQSRAKADCTTKNNVNFRLRLYRGRGDDITSIIVEIQRREGFDLMFPKDVFAIFDAAEGKAADPMLNEVLNFQDPDDYAENYTDIALDKISEILCPDEGITTAKGREITLPVLNSLTNLNKTGRTAILVSRDLLHAEKFTRLRDLILSYASLTGNYTLSIAQYNRVKLLSLEILANAASCTRDSEGAFSFRKSLLLHLISLVEDASADPRAADLACLILSNSDISSLDEEEITRLKSALNNARSYGAKVHADLEEHSRRLSIFLQVMK